MLNSTTFVTVLGQCSSRRLACFVATWKENPWCLVQPGIKSESRSALLGGAGAQFCAKRGRCQGPAGSAALGQILLPTGPHGASVLPQGHLFACHNWPPFTPSSFFTSHLLLMPSVVHSQMSLQIFCTKYSPQYSSVGGLCGIFIYLFI